MEQQCFHWWGFTTEGQKKVDYPLVAKTFFLSFFLSFLIIALPSTQCWR
jgi:hypothetical protein